MLRTEMGDLGRMRKLLAVLKVWVRVLERRLVRRDMGW